MTIDEVLADARIVADNRTSADHIDRVIAHLTEALGLSEAELVRIPVLMSMFRMLDTLDWREQPLAGNPRWFVMGQVCVAEAYRAMGVFDGMNHHLRENYADRFDMTITEVSSANPRSLRAHRRVGFETMHVYEDPEADEVWEVVIWDWR